MRYLVVFCNLGCLYSQFTFAPLATAAVCQTKLCLSGLLTVTDVMTFDEHGSPYSFLHYYTELEEVQLVSLIPNPEIEEEVDHLNHDQCHVIGRNLEIGENLDLGREESRDLDREIDLGGPDREVEVETDQTLLVAGKELVSIQLRRSNIIVQYFSYLDVQSSKSRANQRYQYHHKGIFTNTVTCILFHPGHV